MKKTLKKAILFIIIILIPFLFYSNLKTSGIWVGTYQFFSDSPNVSKHLNESVLEFKNQKVRNITPFQNIDSIPKRYYLSIGNHMFANLMSQFDLVQTEIKNYNNDSLIVKGDNLTRVYRKIPNSLKYKSKKSVELKNKFFNLKKDELIDSVFFSEKFLFIRKKDNERKIWDSSGYWELKKVNDYYILFTNFNPQIVHKSDEGLLFYQISENGINEIEVIESEGNIEEINIIYH